LCVAHLFCKLPSVPSRLRRAIILLMTRQALFFFFVTSAVAQTVTVDWLLKEKSDPSLVVLDTRPEAEYAKGHIPGAVPVNLYDHLVDSSPEGEQKFHQWLIDTLGRLGIGPKDRIVVYEERLGIRAARAFWMLYYAGQPKVGLLGGGLEAWRQARQPVSTDPAPPRAPTIYKLRPQKKWMATAREVAALGKDRETVIRNGGYIARMCAVMLAKP